MIPYLCPEMPETQKAALHQIIKTPLVYTAVALRNWTASNAWGFPASLRWSPAFGQRVKLGLRLRRSGPG